MSNNSLFIENTIRGNFLFLHIYFANTVELQWLEHLWSRENMFETGVRRHNEDTFLIFYNMKIYYVFSLESPMSDSDEYT